MTNGYNKSLNFPICELWVFCVLARLNLERVTSHNCKLQLIHQRCCLLPSCTAGHVCVDQGWKQGIPHLARVKNPKPGPDQLAYWVINPVQHKGKEEDWGGKGEDGTRAFGAISCSVGLLVFHGVEFAGGELHSFQIPDGYRIAVCRRNAPQCRKLYLIFQTLQQEGTSTASLEGLSCPNTGFPWVKGLIEL